MDAELNAFAEWLKVSGHAPGTIRSYQGALRRPLRMLPIRDPGTEVLAQFPELVALCVLSLRQNGRMAAARLLHHAAESFIGWRSGRPQCEDEHGEHPELDGFEIWLDGQGCSHLTVKAYGGAVLRFAAWHREVYGTPIGPDAVSPERARAYRTHLTTTRRPATVNSELTALRAFGRFLEEVGGQSAHPITRLRDVPAHRSAGALWLSHDEFCKLLEKGLTRLRPAARLMVLLISEAGLTPQTLIDLRWEQIRRGSGFRISLHLDRVVTCQSRVLYRALGSYAEAVAPGLRFPIGRVFRGRGDGPSSLRAIQRAVQECGQSAAISDLTPSRLFHTYCRRLVVEQHLAADQLALQIGRLNADGSPNIAAVSVYFTAEPQRQRWVRA